MGTAVGVKKTIGVEIDDFVIVFRDELEAEETEFCDDADDNDSDEALAVLSVGEATELDSEELSAVSDELPGIFVDDACECTSPNFDRNSPHIGCALRS